MNEARYKNGSLPSCKPASKLAVVFGENVRRQRIGLKLNKRSFAESAGISRPTLNNIEQGTSNVTLLLVERIADALGVEADELLRKTR